MALAKHGLILKLGAHLHMCNAVQSLLLSLSVFVKSHLEHGSGVKDTLVLGHLYQEVTNLLILQLGNFLQGFLAQQRLTFVGTQNSTRRKQT